MILTIKNQTTDALSYLGGLVTVSSLSNTVVPRDFNVILMGDATFLFDATAERIIVNNGSSDLSGPSVIDLAKVLSAFTLEPVATLPIYYTVPVSIEQTTTTAANSTVWSMRNAVASPLQVIIERIYLITAFDNATPLGVNTLQYDLRRFSAATPTGGNSVTVVKMNNLGPATTVTDVRTLDTGLTVSGVSFESPFVVLPVPEIRGATIAYFRDKMAMKLAPGEGLAIRLATAAVNGQSIYGEISWSQR